LILKGNAKSAIRVHVIAIGMVIATYFYPSLVSLQQKRRRIGILRFNALLLISESLTYIKSSS